jgi:uncharacterized protein
VDLSIELWRNTTSSTEQAFTTSQIAICDQIVEEIVRALIDKMDWDRPRVDRSMRIYLEDAKHVPVFGGLRGICRDPKDDMVLECAITGQAQVIITGDKDLLVLGKYEGIRILSSRDYFEEAGSLPS